MRTINHHLLFSFNEAVRHASISTAADTIGIAKSAVSKHISQLESLLGVQLLQRSSRRLSLTPAGKRLLPHIQSLLAEGDRLFQLATEHKQTIYGLVRIASTPEFGGFVAERLFPHLADHFPDLRIAMEPTYDFADLQDPSFDFALRIGNIKDERLVVRSLGQFKRILIAAPDDPRAQNLRSPAELEHCTCLTFSGTSTETQWKLTNIDDPEQESRQAVNGKFAVKSFQVLTQLVERGVGLAFVPDFLVRDKIQKGQLLHCLPEWASDPMEVYVTYRSENSRIARVKAVIDEVLSMVPGLLMNESRMWKKRERNGA